QPSARRRPSRAQAPRPGASDGGGGRCFRRADHPCYGRHMKRLEDATAKLDQALARLERAASGRTDREAKARVELEQALAQLKTDHTRLSEAADTVSARLDGAIGQLRLMAGE